MYNLKHNGITIGNFSFTRNKLAGAFSTHEKIQNKRDNSGVSSNHSRTYTMRTEFRVRTIGELISGLSCLIF